MNMNTLVNVQVYIQGTVISHIRISCCLIFKKCRYYESTGRPVFQGVIPQIKIVHMLAFKEQ